MGAAVIQLGAAAADIVGTVLADTAERIIDAAGDSKREAALLRENGVDLPTLEKLAGGEGFSGQAPGGPSRWATERSAEWTPVDPKLVVEVSFDHVSNGRFRHGTKLLRFRPDKRPSQCRMEQIA